MKSFKLDQLGDQQIQFQTMNHLKICHLVEQKHQADLEDMNQIMVKEPAILH